MKNMKKGNGNGQEEPRRLTNWEKTRLVFGLGGGKRSAGGMVTVVMNGRHEVVSVKIEPEVVNPSDVEMLEDLVIAALGEARSKVDEMIKQEMSSLTGGLPIPGMF
jgi:DNA-binding YbaB/EbfC family protein